MGFLVMGLPRSRTFWLSRLLGGVHDPSAAHLNFYALLNTLQTCGGVDTGLVLKYPQIRWHLPGLPCAAVFRPIQDVEASLTKLGIKIPLQPFIDALEALKSDPSVLCLSYAALDLFDCCDKLHRHCRNTPLSRPFWEQLRRVNLQCDAAKQLAARSPL